jgi:hypothetical protein
MNLKLFIIFFATALGAITTVGCRHDQTDENSADNMTNNPPAVTATNLANTNSAGSVSVPSTTDTNNLSVTNHP